MKKMYQKPQAEVVKVRCKDKLLWGEEGNASNPYNEYEAKEAEIRFEEEQEMHEVLGGIFSSDNLVNPWE